MIIESLLSAVAPSVVLVGSKRLEDRMTVGVTKVALRSKLVGVMMTDGVVGPVPLTPAREVMAGGVENSVGFTAVDDATSTGVVVKKRSDEVAAVPLMAMLVGLTKSEDTIVELLTMVLFAVVVGKLVGDAWTSLLDRSAAVELKISEVWLMSEIVGRATVVLYVDVSESTPDGNESKVDERLLGTAMDELNIGAKVEVSGHGSVALGSMIDDQRGGMLLADVSDVRGVVVS